MLGETLREGSRRPLAHHRGLAEPEEAGRGIVPVVNANLPSLVHHWLMIHAELGTFGLLVTSGTA